MTGISTGGGGDDEVTSVEPTEATEGEEPDASGSDALAIGVASAIATANRSIAVGNDAEASDYESVAIGTHANATLRSSTAVGRYSKARDTAATSLGAFAAADGVSSVSIGNNTDAKTDDSVAVGHSALSSGSEAIAVGHDAEASGLQAVAFGRKTVASDTSAAALGNNTSATKEASTAVGRGGEALNAGEGMLGGDSSFHANDWRVPGDFSVSGSKNFEIDHPSAPDTHDLKHGAYEGPVPGGLLYNATVTADADRVDLTGHLPEYVTEGDFGRDWTCHVTASDHFGRGYVDAAEWELVVEEPGDYEVTIFGERDDPAALKNGGDRVEKPKGEMWDGTPRNYWRDCPHVDPDNYADVLRVEALFEHTEECSPEPCEEAHVRCRVTFEDGERVDVDADYAEDGESIVKKAREQMED